MSIQPLNITNIPNEMLIEIFSKLNPKELIIASLVCKFFSKQANCLHEKYKKEFLSRFIDAKLNETYSQLIDQMKDTFPHLTFEKKEIEESSEPSIKRYRILLREHISKNLCVSDYFLIIHSQKKLDDFTTKNMRIRRGMRSGIISKWKKIMDTMPTFESMPSTEEEEKELNKTVDQLFIKKGIKKK